MIGLLAFIWIPIIVVFVLDKGPPRRGDGWWHEPMSAWKGGVIKKGPLLLAWVWFIGGTFLYVSVVLPVLRGR